jgi:hypothetical protein
MHPRCRAEAANKDASGAFLICSECAVVLWQTGLRYIGYYEPYANSHDAFDRDELVQEEARNDQCSFVGNYNFADSSLSPSLPSTSFLPGGNIKCNAATSGRSPKVKLAGPFGVFPEP